MWVGFPTMEGNIYQQYLKSFGPSFIYIFSFVWMFHKWAPLQSKRCLTLILVTWSIGCAPSIASKWQMGFNLAFKGLSVMLLKSVLVCPPKIIHFVVPHGNVFISCGFENKHWEGWWWEKKNTRRCHYFRCSSLLSWCVALSRFTVAVFFFAILSVMSQFSTTLTSHLWIHIGLVNVVVWNKGEWSAVQRTVKTSRGRGIGCGTAGRNEVHGSPNARSEPRMFFLL
jgi:hypothetical protein